MSLHRGLSRALLTKNILPVKRALANIDKRNIVATPPMEKISSAEKGVMAVILTVSVSFIPAWVLYHVREYQGEKRN